MLFLPTLTVTCTVSFLQLSAWNDQLQHDKTKGGGGGGGGGRKIPTEIMLLLWYDTDRHTNASQPARSYSVTENYTASFQQPDSQRVVMVYLAVT